MTKIQRVAEGQYVLALRDGRCERLDLPVDAEYWDEQSRKRWGALCDGCDVTGCDEPCSGEKARTFEGEGEIR